MEVHEALAHLRELLGVQSVGHPHQSPGKWERTSISRLAPGFVWVYWTMFPCGIRGLMMHNGNMVSETSMIGSTFG